MRAENGSRQPNTPPYAMSVNAAPHHRRSSTMSLLPSVARGHDLTVRPHTDAILCHLPSQGCRTHHHSQCDPPQHSTNEQCHARACTHVQSRPNQAVL